MLRAINTAAQMPVAGTECETEGEAGKEFFHKFTAKKSVTGIGHG